MVKFTPALGLSVTLFVILAVSASYYRFIVLSDYIIEVQVSCDPTAESCFHTQCGEADETCSEVAGGDEEYFKYLYIPAQAASQCSSDDESCLFQVCGNHNHKCTILSCDKETIAQYEQGVECSEEQV